MRRELSRCRATIYVKDTMRYTGRGVGGFEMHYTEARCARKARDNGFCFQHQGERFKGGLYDRR